MLRIGNTAGSTGPTVFLSKGASVKDGYTSKWLTQNGAILQPNALPAVLPVSYASEASSDEESNEEEVDVEGTEDA